MQQPQHAPMDPQTLRTHPTEQTMAPRDITATTTTISSSPLAASQGQQQKIITLSPYPIPRNKPQGGPLRAPYRRAILLLLEFPPIQLDIFRTQLFSSGVVVRHVHTWDIPSDLARLQPDLLIAYHATVETCTLLRAAFSHLPLLVCLPPEAKKSHLVELLDAGADDCVSVTIGKAELQARLRALLRSYDSPALLAMPSAPIQIISDDWCMHLDLVSRCVSVREQPIHLTEKECGVLYQLMLQSEKVVTRDSLLRTVWGPEYLKNAESLSVYIHHLRAKLEVEPSRPHYLITIPCVGYSFRQPCSLFLRQEET